MSKAPITAQRRDKADVFSLAFLDIISCGFGAVVVLILIFKLTRFLMIQPRRPSRPTMLPPLPK